MSDIISSLPPYSAFKKFELAFRDHKQEIAVVGAISACVIATSLTWVFAYLLKNNLVGVNQAVGTTVAVDLLLISVALVSVKCALDARKTNQLDRCKDAEDGFQVSNEQKTLFYLPKGRDANKLRNILSQRELANPQYSHIYCIYLVENVSRVLFEGDGNYLYYKTKIIEQLEKKESIALFLCCDPDMSHRNLSDLARVQPTLKTYMQQGMVVHRVETGSFAYLYQIADTVFPV